MNEHSQSGSCDDVPVAHTRPVRSLTSTRSLSRLWVVTALCVVFSLVLVAVQWRPVGPTVEVTFTDGYGLQAGDAVRYRGIDIGVVKSVELGPDMREILVRLELNSSASSLAREGTRFWIERPRLSLSRVEGLDTVMGPKYVGVQPGPTDGPRVYAFEGVAAPQTLLAPAPAQITITFADGRGLQVGDPLKHRGIIVGEVVGIGLSDDLRNVEVAVQLAEAAAGLAREGSQFWIERPQVRVGNVSGLETIVGGRHLAVRPAGDSLPVSHHFVGLEEPIAVAEDVDAGLTILLVSPERAGLQAGAPLTYRGVEVGQVLSVGLARDTTNVEARVGIKPEYESIVRKNSVFWSVSGIDFRLGWRGIDMDIETLSTIAAGGVAMATPDPPGNRVTKGERFPMALRPEERWLQWAPRMSFGLPTRQAGDVPELLRAAARTERRRFGIYRSSTHYGWVVPLDDGSILGPADVVAPLAGSWFEVAGKRYEELAGDANNGGASIASSGRVRRRHLREFELPLDFPRWELSRVRAPLNTEDLLLVAGPGQSTIPVSKSHLQPTEGQWTISPPLSVGPQWHGGCALSASDGDLVGVVLADGETASIGVIIADQLQL
ncbi:MAG: MlaD family protein [Pirellulaceae bacterium]|nr:MCE family protein [Planctomycetales bacterium]